MRYDRRSPAHERHEDVGRSDPSRGVRTHCAGRRDRRHEPRKGLEGFAARGVAASARAARCRPGDGAPRRPPHPLPRRAERPGASGRLAWLLPHVLERALRKPGKTAEGSRVMSESHAITIEKVLPYGPEKIWRTLTSSEMVARWLMPNDLAAVVGPRFNFRTTPMGDWDGVIDCEVLEADPPRLLCYSWQGGSDTNPAY